MLDGEHEVDAGGAAGEGALGREDVEGASAGREGTVREAALGSGRARGRRWWSGAAGAASTAGDGEHGGGGGRWWSGTGEMRQGGIRGEISNPGRRWLLEL